VQRLPTEKLHTDGFGGWAIACCSTARTVALAASSRCTQEL
jgi:hypothetical protein